MRYLIKFKYDGTKFHGFQRQNNVKNVQGTIENVLSKYLDEDIVIKGSGRTDAGVHAYGQCAHFDTNKILNKQDLKKINKMFSLDDLEILTIKKVNDNFHARYNVKEKVYVYKINVGKYDSNLEGYYYQIKDNLNYKKMNEACVLLEGTHDFRNFVSGERDDYVSTIYKIKIKHFGKKLEISFRGIGFYRYMVRHLVSAILSVGKEKITLKELEERLNKKEEFKNLGVAPAEGLYLKKVKY